MNIIMDVLNTSAEYRHLDVALKSLWPAFVQIKEDWNTFSPRLISDYDNERNILFQHLRDMNPDLSTESIADSVDRQIKFAATEQVQRSDQFSGPLMTQYVLVTMLSHALCEAAINAILALSLAQTNSQEHFSTIEKKNEKKNIIEKWQEVPKDFSPNYELKTGTALSETLKYLTTQRNALVHSKIRVNYGVEKNFERSKSGRRPLVEKIDWMHRFFSLPYDLSEHARSQLSSHAIFILNDRDPILRADVHKRSM